MCDLHGTIGELTQGSSDRMRSSLAQEHRCFWRSPVHLLHLLHVAWRLTARGKMRKKRQTIEHLQKGKQNVFLGLSAWTKCEIKLISYTLSPALVH